MNDSSVPLSLDSLLQHQDFLRSVARALLQQDGHRAEDVAQEAFLAASQRGPRHVDNPRPWLRGIVRNIVRKMARGQMRREQRERIAPRPTAPETAGDTVQRLELHRDVVEAVLALQESYREALCLRFYDDLTPVQIAERLGVPLNTVRGRLRRGLAQLRGTLHVDGDDERARAVRRGLTVLAGSPLAAGSAATATTATSGGTVFGLSPAPLIAFGVLLLAVAGWWRFGFPFTGSEPELTASPRVASSSATPGEKGPAREEPVVVLDEREDIQAEEPSPPTRPTENPSGAPETPDATGLFSLQVVDALDGHPLASYDLRMLSETHILSWNPTGPATFCVATGTYDVRIAAPGYDPFEPGPYRVSRGERVDLGALRLQRGTGILEGSFPGLGGTAHVELYGIGRGPCSQCVEEDEATGDDETPEQRTRRREGWERTSPCSACGYQKDHSELVINPPADGFCFRNLAAGTYFVRVKDFIDVPIDLVEVTLAPGERHSCTLDVPLHAELEVHLRDADGVRLVGPIERDRDGRPVGFQYSFRREGKLFARAFVPGHESGRTSMSNYHQYGLPDQQAQSFRKVQSFGQAVTATLSKSEVEEGLPEALDSLFEGLVLGFLRERGLVPNAAGRFDRLRDDSDVLVPVVEPPSFKPSQYHTRHRGRPMPHILCVPGGTYEISLEHGVYQAGPTTVEITGSKASLTLTLAQRPNVRTR